MSSDNWSSVNKGYKKIIMKIYSLKEPKMILTYNEVTHSRMYVELRDYYFLN